MGFALMGHLIIRKRGRRGMMRLVSTIPQEKSRGFGRASSLRYSPAIIM